MVAYMCKFIKDCFELTSPLNQLMSSERTFKWTPLKEVYFDKLEEHLSAGPMLQYPQANGTYQVETDTFIYGNRRRTLDNDTRRDFPAYGLQATKAHRKGATIPYP